MKKNLICIFSVLGAAITAIIVHAILPSPGASMDTSSFDSVLVKQFGFPAVASAYFIILYLHILVVIRWFGSKTVMNRKEVGLRFGLAYALIYLVGMQEVVVAASPFEAYGVDFILYQFFMGLGDAIPVIILCITVSHFALKETEVNKKDGKSCRKEKVIMTGTITGLFFTERVIGYVTGYIDSDFNTYPLPVLIWTILFGVTFGCAYFIIRPIYNNKNDKKNIAGIVVASLGVNWIWFNSFMGLILKNTIFQMIFRSGMDVIVIFIGILVSRFLHFFVFCKKDIDKKKIRW